MRNSVVFATDGIEIIPLQELVRWFHLGGSEPIMAGVPGVSRVFIQGSGSGIDTVGIDELNASEVRGLIVPESPTLVHELQRPAVGTAIEAFLEADVPIVTWGGGITAFLKAGLLTAREVAGPYESLPDLVGEGVEVSDEAVVADGLWITARSALELPRILQIAFGFGSYLTGETTTTAREARS